MKLNHLIAGAICLLLVTRINIAYCDIYPLDTSDISINNEESIEVLKTYNVYDCFDLSTFKTNYPEPVILLGRIYYNRHQIYVDSKLEGDVKEYVILHELGHALDGGLSISENFIEIFNKEKAKLKKQTNEYEFVSKSWEFFAESYAMYVTKPYVLKEYGPLTYEFMDTHFHEERLSK